MIQEEMLMVRHFARSIAEDYFLPAAKDVDNNQRIPESHVWAMAENKLFGTSVPSRYGGGGLSHLNKLIIIEEVARCCGSTSMLLTNQDMVINPIVKGGSEEQKISYLLPLTSGELIGAFAITEEGLTSDLQSVYTTAEKMGDHYILNGKKLFVFNAGKADIFIIAASINPTIEKAGITYFIVEKGTPGLTLGREVRKMGVKGMSAREIILENVRIHHSQLVGGEGKGFKILKETLNRTRLNVAAQALGIAQGAYEEVIKYAHKFARTSRESLRFHNTQLMLAEMATEIEAARRLLYYGGEFLDSGSSKAAATASMAKLFCSNVAMKVTTDAVQMLEGSGYTDDYPVERMMRDAKITQIYEGSNLTQKLVIARQVLL
ncbi:acyl-CoA dehydrogenase family protein [Mesobacillus campisalis]|uniref:acyl-CoA dehydrogenase family protein n=1 Tax=Mesobacillus campisalis TaxID=1408103 RepID=UPI000699357F|nr:acyl-CoA dehydrogenase family protein [Mesobacillus campisalis]